MSGLTWRLKRLAFTLAGIVVVVAAVATVALFVVTNTNFGRTKVRQQLLSVLQSKVHGIVHVGRIEGNLLGGMTVHDVSITDSAGIPFITAQEARARYRLANFIDKKLWFYDVTLVRPLILFDRPPGSTWNVVRLFPSTPHPPGYVKVRGFGDDIAMFNVKVIDGHAVVRAPWLAPESLSVAQRDSQARAAIAAGTRNIVVKTPTGYQKVTDISSLNGVFPRIILADWDRDTQGLGRLIEIRTAKFIAAIFQPPVIDVRDVKGVFEFNTDSAWWSNVQAALPSSRVTATGKYFSQSSALHLVAQGPQVAFADFRWVYPRLPSSGGGRLDLNMDWTEHDGDIYQVRNADLRTQGAHASGDFGATLFDSALVFHDVNLDVAGVSTRLIEQLAPSVHAPRRGVLGGHLAMAGSIHALKLQTDATFDDAQAGRNRVIAVGEVGVAPKGSTGFHVRNLRVRALPVQVALAKSYLPTLPIGGTVSGAATLDGGPAGWTVSNADLTHEDRGAVSRLTGRAQVAMTTKPYRVDVALRAVPLSLVTVGRFMPAVGLQGVASGPIEVHGAMNGMRVHSLLAVTGGGSIGIDGRLAVAGKASTYDLGAALQLFNAHAVVAKAPQTTVTAVAHARGQGFDPATMRATFAADVKASAFDSVRIDSAVARLTIANGLLNVQTLALRGPGSTIDARGSFGLAAGRTGELTFRAHIDSLAALARWLPKDTGVVEPRPGTVAQALRKARADSARLAQATEVERAVTGAPPPKLKASLPPPVRADSIAGKVDAAGTIRGSLAAFDLRMRAATEKLVAVGSTLRRGRAEVAWLGARTPQAAFVVAAQLDSASLKGFAIDSADARGTWQQGHGTVALFVGQGGDHTHELQATYALHLASKELDYSDLRLRLDTTVWTSPRPGAIRWGNGLVLQTVELRNAYGGRIYADGTLPAGPVREADLQLAIQGFDIGQIFDLMQSDIDAHGQLELAAHVQGTTADPRVRGAVALVNVVLGGTPAPDVRGTLDYENARLVTRMEASRGGGTPLARLAATLPLNLAMGATGPRLPTDAPISVDFDADSLPLEVLPKLTSAVTNVRGRTMGSLKIRGTIAKPHAVGAIALDLGSFGVVASGTRVRNLQGTIRIQDDTVMVDSLVGYAGGPIRISGGIGIATLTQPSFDLQVTAKKANLLDTERGRAEADVNLAIYGPFVRPYVSGDVRVRNGVIYIPKPDHRVTISAGDPAVFNVADTSLASDRELLPAQSPLLSNLRMDIALTVDRQTWVRSTEANVEIYSDGPLTIHVDRARNALALEGVLATDYGEYQYLGKRFQIRRGSATFIGQPELNPTLQITGEYEVKIPGREALVIRLLVGGTVQDPRLALESDAQPPIPQSDLLSYLAFGRSSSSLLTQEGSSITSGGSGGGVVGATAALASQQLTGVALSAALSELQGNALRSRTLDVLNITPADVPTEIWRPNLNSFVRGTEVEAGKYITPRDFVAFQGRLDLQAVPGMRYQSRGTHGMSLQLSFEPRYLLQDPSLRLQTPTSVGVFGAFLIREWRF